jgi:hypothetical protein
MKGRFFIPFFFLIAFCTANTLVYAQSDTLNATDAQGWKQGKWIENSDGDDAEGCSAGTKLEEGYYKDNRKIGAWRKFWCNGKLKNELVYTFTYCNRINCSEEISINTSHDTIS